MVGVAALVVVADQITKYLVATRLAEGESWIIATWLRPIVQVTHVTNTGVAFGLFPKLGGLFTLVAVGVVIFIFLYQRSLPQAMSSPVLWLMRVALGLQLGGAIGNNLIDRPRQGFVVDFIDLNFWPMRDFAVFNVADSSIVVGVIILALVIVLEERRERAAPQVVEAASEPR
jgi:signal peptidase II